MIVLKLPAFPTGVKRKLPLVVVAGYAIKPPAVPPVAIPELITPASTSNAPTVICWVPVILDTSKLAVVAPVSGIDNTCDWPTDAALLIVVLKLPPLFVTAARINLPLVAPLGNDVNVPAVPLKPAVILPALNSAVANPADANAPDVLVV